MTRTVLVLLVTLLSSPAFAQAPADPAKEAAKLHSEAREWIWTGAALAAGGLVYELLGQTALASENTFCTSTFNLASCTTIKDPNMGAVYGGAIMAVGGGVMMIVGGMKEGRAKKLAPSVTFSKGGWLVQKRVQW